MHIRRSNPYADQGEAPLRIGMPQRHAAPADRNIIEHLIVGAAAAAIRCQFAVVSASRRGSQPEVLARIGRAERGLSRLSDAAAGGMPVPETGDVVVELARPDRPPGTCHLLQAILASSADEQLMLTLGRENGDAGFCKDEIASFRRLMPTLAAVASSRSRLTAAFDRAGAATEVLQIMNIGVIAVDTRGDVLMSNAAAQEILCRRQAVRVLDGRLVFDRAATNDRFHQVLQATGSPDIDGNRTERAVMVDCDDGGRLELVLVPLTTPVGATAIVVSDPAARQTPDQHRMRELYGLTRVEAEIVGHIARGLKPNEIAAEMRISRHTIRAYLKPIFQKLEVRCQAGLVRVVALGCSLLQWRSNQRQLSRFAGSSESLVGGIACDE